MNKNLMREAVEEIEMASILLDANGINIKELKIKDIKKVYSLLK
jgi:hypothetical protein